MAGRFDLPVNLLTMNEFSVCQFFASGSYEFEKRFISIEEAVKCAKFCTTNVSAKMGLIKRVIIVDGGDCIVFEWEYGKGITFPPREK